MNRKYIMPEPPASIEDWYTWILGTIVTVITTLVGTIVTMAKAMESKYKQEINDLKARSAADIAEIKVSNAASIAEIKVTVREQGKHIEDCNKDREEYRVRLAALEAQQKTNDISGGKLH